MKKRLLAIVMLYGVLLTGCGNQAFFDTNYTFNRAIINLGNGEVIEVDIKTRDDYEGEQIQITAEDGTVYLTSSYNCTLIRDK